MAYTALLLLFVYCLYYFSSLCAIQSTNLKSTPEISLLNGTHVNIHENSLFSKRNTSLVQYAPGASLAVCLIRSVENTHMPTFGLCKILCS